MENNQVRSVAGENKTLQLVILDDNQDPLNLTGWVLYYTLKSQSTEGATAIVSKNSTSSSQIELLTPLADGIANIYLLPVDTISLAPGPSVAQFFYDVWGLSPLGKKVNLLSFAKHYISPRITHVP